MIKIGDRLHRPVSAETRLLLFALIFIIVASISLAIVWQEVENKGLKSILMEVWEGKPKGRAEVLQQPKLTHGFPCWIGDEHINFKLVYVDSVAYAECGSCGSLIKLKLAW